MQVVLSSAICDNEKGLYYLLGIIYISHLWIIFQVTPLVINVQ